MATRSATRPGWRYESWDAAPYLAEQIERVDELLIPLVTKRAPRLLALYGVGPDSAALLLVAAGDRPERLRSEAAWAPARCGHDDGALDVPG